ncbi:MAG: hypothetical protein ACOX2W_12685 [Desulfomonilia bacterium]
MGPAGLDLFSYHPMPYFALCLIGTARADLEVMVSLEHSGLANAGVGLCANNLIGSGPGDA